MTPPKENTRLVYKVQGQQADSSRITIDDESQMNAVERLQNKFLAIEVRCQSYKCKAAIAIYINDVTKKINGKVKEMHHREKQQEATQTESFTATMSHEMRTPLGTVLFFIKLIQDLIVQIEGSTEAQNYLKLIETQILFMQTFVNDLLDLRLIK